MRCVQTNALPLAIHMTFIQAASSALSLAAPHLASCSSPCVSHSPSWRKQPHPACQSAPLTHAHQQCNPRPTYVRSYHARTTQYLSSVILGLQSAPTATLRSKYSNVVVMSFCVRAYLYVTRCRACCPWPAPHLSLPSARACCRQMQAA